MAMKPAGKAILILAVVGAIGGAVWKSGVLDKAPAPAAQPVIAVEPAVTPTQPAPAVVAAPAAPAQEAPAPKAKDALDALIHEQKK